MIVRIGPYFVAIREKQFSRLCIDLGFPPAKVPLLEMIYREGPVQYGKGTYAMYFDEPNVIALYAPALFRNLRVINPRLHDLLIALILAHELSHTLCIVLWQDAPVGKRHNRAHESLRSMGAMDPLDFAVDRYGLLASAKELNRRREEIAERIADNLIKLFYQRWLDMITVTTI